MHLGRAVERWKSLFNWAWWQKVNELLGKINNDTVAILGLIAVACFYAATGTGEQVVAAITGGMLGYITRANNS